MDGIDSETFEPAPEDLGALVPRATIEELVGYRNKALELYREAFAAIETADRAIKAARAMGRRAAPHGTEYFGYDQASEVQAFMKAVQLPDAAQYMRVATRLLDIDVWGSLIRHTDLESLMDHEAKETLRRQMRYIPERTGRDGQLITGEEVERGLPPVTVENIYATLQRFAMDAGSIFRRGVANVFSKLDRRFRSHDGFKVGSRIILTYAFSSMGGGLDYGRVRDQLIDIERAFRILDGDGIPSDRNFTRGVHALDNDRRGGHWGPKQSETETEYFLIRGYKNGNAPLVPARRSGREGEPDPRRMVWRGDRRRADPGARHLRPAEGRGADPGPPVRVFPDPRSGRAGGHRKGRALPPERRQTVHDPRTLGRNRQPRPPLRDSGRAGARELGAACRGRAERAGADPGPAL